MTQQQQQEPWRLTSLPQGPRGFEGKCTGTGEVLPALPGRTWDALPGDTAPETVLATCPNHCPHEARSLGEQPPRQTQGLPCSQNPLMWVRSSGTKCQSVTLTPQTPWAWESGGPENHGGRTEGAERLSVPRTRPGLHSGFRAAPRLLPTASAGFYGAGAGRASRLVSTLQAG